MADLRPVEGLRPERTLTTYQGIMVKVGDTLAVNVNGNVLPARWADPLVVAHGDRVLVEISSGRPGQGAAFVRSRVTDKPRPGTGTVTTVPASSPTITVTGVDGVVYTATFISSYTPIVNDNIVLDWKASVPTVMGKVATTAAPTTLVAPVQAPPSSSGGRGSFPASQSDTYWPAGGWGSWAGGGGHVYQGNYGSGQVFGAWFYAGSTAQLAGKAVTKLQFTLGPRRAVGNNNSPVTVHLYAHTSPSRPGGDVARVAGPHDIVVQPGQGLTTYDLPLAFAAALQGGGGIAMTGDPYAGFFGCITYPESGLIYSEWGN